MCGRYATTRSAADLAALFDALDQTGAGELDPRYNVAPTDPVPAVLRPDRRPAARGPAAAESDPAAVTADLAQLSPLAAGQRVLATARWGLLPHWAKDPRDGARMINARAETVATSRAYAQALASRRALLPADGWYEWRRLPDGGKQPYFLTPSDGSVLAMAGLWSRWGSERLLTVAVVTTAAGTEDLAEIHDRMPLLLPPDRWERWLSGDPALDPPPRSWLARLELRPVGPAVGNVRNDGPELMTRVDLERAAETAAPGLFSLDQLANPGTQ